MWIKGGRVNCRCFFLSWTPCTLDSIGLGNVFPMTFTHIPLALLLSLDWFKPIKIQSVCNICHLVANALGMHISSFLPFIIKLPQRVSVWTASPQITPVMFSLPPATSTGRMQRSVLAPHFTEHLSNIQSSGSQTLSEKSFSRVEFSDTPISLFSSTLTGFSCSVSKCLNFGAS